MSDTVLQIIVNGKDNASDVLSGVGRTVAGLGKLALGAGVVVGGALAGGLAVAAKAATEAEEISAQLNAVLESTKGVAGMTAEAIQEQALALSEVTRFEDDAIVSAQSLLLTFTKIGKDTFPDATEATLDVAQAMKMDLRSAALLVGKALNDPTRGLTALTRSGVQFTEQQQQVITSLVETGDLAAAQAMILEELETQFGGSARAGGDTFAGQLDILKNSLGNVAEEIGGAVLPLLRDLLAWVGPKLVAGFKEFGRWASDGLAKIGTFADQVKRVISDVQAGRPISWDTLFDMAGLVTKNRDMRVWFAEAVQDVQGFVEDVKAAYETGGITAAIDEAFGQIGGALKTAWDNIDWEEVKTKLSTYWTETLQPSLRTAVAQLREWTATDPELLTSVGTAIGDMIVAGIATGGYDYAGQMGGKLGELMGSSVDGVSFWDGFSASLQRGITPPTLQTAINGVMDAMLARVVEEHPKVQAFLDTVRGVVDGMSKAVSGYSTLKSDLETGIYVNPLEALMGWLQDTIDRIRNAIAAWTELMETIAGGGAAPFAGVSAGATVTGPAAGSVGGGGIPGAGRAATSAAPVFNITINAPGGDPRAVAAAAQTGVLRAARSMGLA